MLIGADPELFVQAKNRGYISAHDLIPGSKKKPYKVEHGAVQVDGTAAEFNVDPADTREKFVENILSVLTSLQAFIDTASIEKKIPGLTLTCVPTVLYDADYWLTVPESAKELGCDPDLNAYIVKENPKPRATMPLRTGGGHIHVGWQESGVIDDSHIETCKLLVRQMDAVLYALSPLWDDDQIRRRTYGTIGAFRPKSYGVEYRPLSNAWVSDPDMIGWIFDATIACDQLLCNKKRLWDSEMFTNLLEMDGDKKCTLTYHDYLLDEGIPPLPEKYWDE